MADSMTTRIAVLLVAVMAWTAASARADSRLLHPSPRALAAADDDEPPAHEDPRKAKPKAAKAVPEEEAPVYKKWWFWALTAAVVGGTVIFGVTTFKPAQHLPAACSPTAVACFGDGRPQ
jgi:hypothetical protein